MAKRKTHLKSKRGDTIKLVVKSNELVEARYMFNIWETRFFHTLISIIEKDDEDDKTYRIWFKDIKKSFNINSNKTYELLREAAKSLNRKPVYVGWMDDKYRRGREYTLFEFIDYLEEGQKGENIEQQEYVDVKIQEKMRPFLLYVKKNFDPLITRYTSYDLRNIEKLKPYAVRIYELMKQFEYKGVRTISVQDLKDMFLITNEYPRFSTFNQSVVVPSIRAINKYTDLYIDPNKIERIKKGRRVHALRFYIVGKSKKEMAEIRNEVIQPNLFDSVRQEEETFVEQSETDILFNEFEEVVVKSFGVTPSIFIKLLNTQKYTREHIAQAVSVTRRAKFNQEIIKNIAGFFLKALKEGYTDAQEEGKKLKQEGQKKKEELKRQINNLKDELSRRINNKIRVITAEDEAVTLRAIESIKSNPLTEALIRHKEKSLDRALGLDDYRKDEQLRSMVISNIVQIQKEQFDDIMNEFNPKIKQLTAELKKLK